MSPRGIAFRTTASKNVGFGHLRRCLTLAAEMRAAAGLQIPIHFWIDGDAAAVEVASRAGFEARQVAGTEPNASADLVRALGTDVLVADSYDLRPETFAAWRRGLRCLVVVDDLADRVLDVDVVVNGGPYAIGLKYRTEAGCLLLLGAEYALLRAQFRELPPHEIRTTIRRVLVTLGGADPLGTTTVAVATARQALPDAELDVVVGPLFGDMPELDALAAHEPRLVRVHRGLEDLATLMRDVDLAVSAGGQTLFELAATGLPTIAIRLADNQDLNIGALDGVSLLAAGAPPAKGALEFPALRAACTRLARAPELRAALSGAGQRLFDGRGAGRVASAVLGGNFAREGVA